MTVHSSVSERRENDKRERILASAERVFAKRGFFAARVSEIAKELFLSVKTVSTYRSRILEKMNFKSNADITYYAVKNQLIA